jgi:Transglycosylase SLT domain
MSRRPDRPTPRHEPSAPRGRSSARALSTLRALLVASTVAGSAIWGGAVWAQSPEEPVPPATQTAPEQAPPTGTSPSTPPDDPVEWGPVEEVGPPPTIRVPLPPPPPPERSEPRPRPPREPAGRPRKKRRCPDAEELRAGGYGGALAPPPHCEDPAKERPRRRKPSTEPPAPPTTPPAPTAPGFIDALPGPSTATGVPNFIIRKFRVPPFLLPIYQAAGIEYGIRWEILAAINEIETDYGRNLNVSSAGAVGWMQFMPSTWAAYGTDANKDGRKDPYNPVDAIFAAARYLKAANYENDVRAAIWAYNHADWYVDSVLLRARLIAGVPADLIGSLTGLTEGRFPVYARARYADTTGRSLRIFSRPDAPIVAVNDGVVRRIGRNEKLGRFVVLEDPYGNRFTYAGLDSVARFHPVPRHDGEEDERSAKALHANGEPKEDPEPTKAASAGRQPDEAEGEDRPAAEGDPSPTDSGDHSAPADHDHPGAAVPIKERLFAHPGLPGSRENGGLEQLIEAEALEYGYEVFDAYFSRPVSLDSDRVRIRRLREGSRVIGGTVLAKADRLDFSIRPAGRGAPRIDPKPILDGWKLLEATAIYRASGRNVLHGEASIGQVLLLPKTALERRVLGDERIEIYDCGRDDIRAGRIDRRVLATLAYLAESGLEPTVTSLECGHGYYTSSGNVSHHSSGNAVDIAAVNGIPVLGHKEPGGITEQTVRRLMQLQGTMAPDQIISLFEIGGATFAMADHADHIHVGFSPEPATVFSPLQWTDLLERLRQIENPVVPRTEDVKPRFEKRSP